MEKRIQEIELNENDNRLLAFCYGQKRYVSEIARVIGIDVKNVSVRIKKLEKAGLIEVIKTSGNKKYIRTLKGDKTKEYFLEILKELKSYKGEMKEEDFLSLLPFSFEKPEDRDKFNAPLKLFFVRPKLIERYVKITPEGEKFLKDNSKG